MQGARIRVGCVRQCPYSITITAAAFGANPSARCLLSTVLRLVPAAVRRRRPGCLAPLARAAPALMTTPRLP